MKFNDMALKPDALSSSRRKLDRSLNEIEMLANQLKSNMQMVSRDFTSQNFLQAEEVVRRVIGKIRDAQEKLQKGRVFLNNVEEIAEMYMKCKYYG